MTGYQQGPLLYEGKAKQIFEVDGEPNLVIMKFKDSLTAFNAKKKDEMTDKGRLNLRITELVYGELDRCGIDTHFVQALSPQEVVVKRLEIIPLEVVVRNWLAGSTAKRFGRDEGEELARPLVEFYLKDDDLNDPLMTDEQALILGYANEVQVREVKARALKINQCLSDFFHRAGIRLIDFKLEFGQDSNGHVMLADEISPDSCRLWDIQSGEKLDKDRFRRDLGGVKEAYQEVLDRLSRL